MHCTTNGSDLSHGRRISPIGESFVFDCLASPICELAPVCASCGRGIQLVAVSPDGRAFCSLACARVGRAPELPQLGASGS